MSAPFLSAIVRTQGNRPTSLTEALGTLKTQIDKDLEIIVVVHGDAPAVNATIDVVDRSDTDARVVSVASGGRAAPLNTGLAAATGDYVGFLDDDDLAMPNWVSIFRTAAEASPGAVLRSACLTQRWTGSDTGEPLHAEGEPIVEFPPDFDLVAHFHSNATPICCFALPRQELADANMTFDAELPVLEDWDLFLRAVCAFGIENVEQVTSLYRRVDRGNSFEHSDDDWINAKQRVLAKLDASPLTLPSGSASILAASHQARLELSYQVVAAAEATESKPRWKRSRR